MARDWDAEWADIEAECRATHKAVVDAHELIKPAPVVGGKTASPKALATFGEAHKRNEAAKARRIAFLAERRISDPKWTA